MDGIRHFVRSLEDLGEDKEVAFHLQNLKRHIDRSYARPENMYSVARRLINDVRPEIAKIARGILKQTREEYQARCAEDKARTEERNAEQTVLELSYIEGVVEDLKRGSGIADMVILAMLCCGARKTEILDPDTSNFFETEDHKKDEIIQAGVAKKKDGDKMVVVKPLLWLDSENFLDLIARIRGFVFKRDEEGKNMKTIAGSIARYSRWLWAQNPHNGNNTGTHINRAIYANCAYLQRRTPNQSITSFVKDVLGHESMSTAANYMQVAISEIPGDILSEEARRQYKASIGPTLVYLKSRDDKLIPFRLPCIRKMTFDERCDLVDWTILKLERNNIPYRRATLLTLGFDSKFLAKYNKANFL